MLFYHRKDQQRPGVEKIEDAVIEKQIEKLKANQKKPQANTETQKPEIDFTTFEKLELRVATVLSAERVPETDKLLHLRVDLGYEQRSVVSGIADQFEPGDLVGRKVCLVANLAPRKIRGIESQGMILMAESADGTLAMIRPDGEMPDGSVIW